MKDNAAGSLFNDDEYRKKLASIEEEIRKKKDSSKKEQEDLLEGLRSVGCNINSVWDLVNSNRKYPEAIPILIKHLVYYEYSDKLKQGILRALAVKESKGYARVLISEYHKTPIASDETRWCFGLAVAVCFTNEDVVEIIEIAKNKLNGRSREFFIKALEGVKKQDLKNKIISELSSIENGDEFYNLTRKIISKLSEK